jgi:hypothetical protein
MTVCFYLIWWFYRSLLQISWKEFSQKKKNKNNSLTSVDIKTGTNYYDRKPGRNHFYVDNCVVFRLLKKQKNNSGKIINKLIAT